MRVQPYRFLHSQRLQASLRFARTAFSAEITFLFIQAEAAAAASMSSDTLLLSMS